MVADETSQSYVDPGDPLRLEFEYVGRICEALDAVVWAGAVRPDDARRPRVVHIGGAGMTIPRWVEARHPRTAQIVLEPDSDLVAEVRRKLPLPRNSGIKVRELPGREGIAAMPADYTDAVVLDAFVGSRVPASLSTAEFFEELRLRLRPGGLFATNIADKAPFGWTKRFVAGVAERWSSVVVCAEPAIWKGRRYGNLVVFAGDALPLTELARLAAHAVFPQTLISGRELRRWLGGAQPWTDADAQDSAAPPGGRGWFG